MARHPLNPDGGKGDFIAFKAARGGKAKLDEQARRLGYESRSELLRALSEYVIATGTLPDDVPAPKHKEDFSQAS